MKRYPAWLAVLALLVLLSPDPVAAQTSTNWLDGPVENWNQSGMSVPTAPPLDPTVDPHCLEQRRPPETPADQALVAADWTLSGSYRAGWGNVAVRVLSGFDGMCRPMGFQELVFVDGILAGTISPDLMNSRSEGAGEIIFLAEDRVVAAYRRYRPEDPLCCPSGSTTVTFNIDRSGGLPVLVPEEPVHQPEG